MLTFLLSQVCHWPKQISQIAPKNKEPEFIFKAVQVFKLVQMFAFALWYVLRLGFRIPTVVPPAHITAVAFTLMVFGQTLNLCVWDRLGVEGVCYGVKFGCHVPFCTKFPYNTFNHPQYLGAVLTVWGMFLFLSAAQPTDWFTVPLIETTLYYVSTKLEY